MFKPWCTGVWLLLPLSATATPTTDQFAYGITLTPEKPAVGYELELPEAVYRGVLHSHLGDLRVFNSSGEIVPHALYLPTPITQPEPVELAFFPISEANPSAQSLALRLRQSEHATELDLSLDPSATGTGKQLTYLLDARLLETAYTALILRWRETAGDGFLAQISLATSNDLSHWRPLINDAVLADLNFGGQRLQRRRIGFSPSTADYLRLQVTGEARMPELTGVVAMPVSTQVEPLLQRLTVAIDASEPGGRYFFTNPGQFRISALELELPQTNTLAQVSISSRSDPQRSWQLRDRKLLYRLVSGEQTLENTRLSVTANQDHEWLLQIDQSGGGLGREPSTVYLFWQAHRLAFVARGEGPFTLAYGSALPQFATGPVSQQLLQDTDIGATHTLLSHAVQIGSQRQLSGPAALVPPAETFAWKPFLLWLLLCGGVATLAWMAWRLWREMESRSSSV